jgi:hypothetical protein
VTALVIIGLLFAVAGVTVEPGRHPMFTIPGKATP